MCCGAWQDVRILPQFAPAKRHQASRTPYALQVISQPYRPDMADQKLEKLQAQSSHKIPNSTRS